MQPDEGVEVALAPVGETLAKELLLLLLLLLGQLDGLVDLALLLLLDLLGVVAEVGVEGHPVANGLAVVVDLLVEELEQPRREELEVLHDGLLRGPGCLVCLGLGRTRSQRLLEVGVDGIVGLALSLRWRDPVQADIVALLLPEVLALEVVQGRLVLRVQRELPERGLAEGGQLLVFLLGLGLARLEQLVDVVLHGVGILVREHVLGAVTNHVQHLVLAEVRLLLGQPTLLNDHAVEAELDGRPLHDLLVDGVLRDEPEHPDLLRLADPVGAIHGLQVHLGVPVGVVQDHDVSRVQVDAEAAGPRGQHEHELFAALGIVVLDLSVSVLVGSLTVNSEETKNK